MCLLWQKCKVATNTRVSGHIIKMPSWLHGCIILITYTKCFNNIIIRFSKYICPIKLMGRKHTCNLRNACHCSSKSSVYEPSAPTWSQHHEEPSHDKIPSKAQKCMKIQKWSHGCVPCHLYMTLVHSHHKISSSLALQITSFVQVSICSSKIA